MSMNNEISLNWLKNAVAHKEMQIVNGGVDETVIDTQNLLYAFKFLGVELKDILELRQKSLKNLSSETYVKEIGRILGADAEIRIVFDNSEKDK